MQHELFPRGIQGPLVKPSKSNWVVCQCVVQVELLYGTLYFPLRPKGEKTVDNWQWHHFFFFFSFLMSPQTCLIISTRKFSQSAVSECNTTKTKNQLLGLPGVILEYKDKKKKGHGATLLFSFICFQSLFHNGPQRKPITTNCFWKHKHLTCNDTS